VTDCWITHFLPDDLPQETLAHTRAFFYNYDSYWYRDALDRRLWDLGERLLFHIGSEIQQCEKVCQPTIAFEASPTKIILLSRTFRTVRDVLFLLPLVMEVSLSSRL
jgi:hypothetical protein